MSLRRNIPGMVAILVASLFMAVHLFTVFFGKGPQFRSRFSDWMAVITGLAAASLMLLAAWRMRASSRRFVLAWALLGAGVFSTMVGDTFWLVYELFFYRTPTPSIADLFYLLYYPLFMAGIWLLPSRKGLRLERAKTTLDILIFLIAVLLVLWNFLIGPVIHTGSGDPLILVLSLAYPAGDFLLFWSLLILLFRSTRVLFSRQFWLLVMGGATTVIVDLLYSYELVQGLYKTGGLIDAGYTVGTLLYALAGFFQIEETFKGRRFSAEYNAPTLPSGPQQFPRKWWNYVPYIGVAGAYFLLMSVNSTHLPMTMSQLSISVGIMISLIIFRQIITMRENNLLSSELRFALAELQRQALRLEGANRDMQIEILERRRAEERLSYDALHDALTGLPNRVLFLDRLDYASRKKKRNPELQYAVLFLDLDSFKVVNDSLGHGVGDQLLIRIAQILLRCVRSTDTVARLGGDEFVILLEEVKGTSDITHTADRLQNELRQPIQLDGNRVFISVSIGIVDKVDDNEKPEDILRDADLAMYQAKSHGKSRYEVFYTGMRANAILRMELENDLRRAIENKEFVLHYQPILELPDQRLIGFEALVRWQHPERGLISPAEFISVAEETGLILPLGEWILNEACHQAGQWRVDFPARPPYRVNVNISGRQLKQPGFIRTVAEALEAHHLPPNCLTLEVTESVCLDNLDTVAATLDALQELGVETQIDDFGTGYSSLSYLQRLPVRSIKIDRSFIHGISDGNSSAPDMIRAIFSMINDLGIKAVAEGIENEAQLAELSRLHCSYVQGFLLAMPMDEVSLEKWLRANIPIHAGNRSALPAGIMSG